MKRQQAKEFLPIIKAFAEGKTIQYYTNLTPHWIDIDPDGTVNFSDYPSNYRIKPEPKYRPFKNQNECWEEMQKHKPIGWIKNMMGIYNIIHIQENTITTHNGTSNVIFSFKNAFNMKFADGTPFGIKE